MTKVLFIGNSHTYYNDMPAIFKNIAKSLGKEVEVQMVASGGVTYDWHLKHVITLRFALMYGGFDYVVCQQAAHPGPAKEETLRDGAKLFDWIKSYGSTPIQTVPWCEKRLPEHQAEMYDIYETLAAETGVKLNPVGRVFEDLRVNHGLDLYYRDGEHANEYGSYAVACCAYATIFGESVKGACDESKFTHEAKISKDDLAMLNEMYEKAGDDAGFNFDVDSRWDYLAGPEMDREAVVRKLDHDTAELIRETVDKYCL